MKNETSLYIIDGHAQIYRAYYAVLGLSSPTGEPTNATFGFCGMLLKLFQGRKPSHVVMAMDAGSVARVEMHAAYKAQRKPMPEDMPTQIERISQIVELAGIPIFRHAGCEADDVIATLVRKIRSDPARGDVMIYMCTKDKDLDQLIDDRTVMFDIQTNEVMDTAGLRAKKGYGPEQARDVLALTGDAVDNIPGIPGVGPKTAAKWIAEYGSIANLLQHKEEVKGKIGEALRGNLAVLEQSQRLVELMFDLPVEMDWEAARAKPERLGALAPIFRELGFNRMMPMLEEVVAAQRGAASVAGGEPAGNEGPKALGHTGTKKDGGAKAVEIPGGLFDHVEEKAECPPGEQPVTPATVAEAVLATESEAAGVSGGLAGGLRPVVGEYRLVNTREGLAGMIAELHTQIAASPEKWLAVDTETDALGAMRSELCGISLSAKEGVAYYVAVKGAGDVLEAGVVRELVGPMLADPGIRKIGQNLKYDINVLRVFGLKLGGMFLDTMVASYVLDSSRLSHGMDALAADLLGLQTIPISDLIGKGAKACSFADVPLERAAAYSGEDADVTLRLAQLLYGRLEKEGLLKLCLEVEMPLVEVLADMEYYGVSIDAGLLAGMSKELAEKMMGLREKIRVAAGVDFNMDSPKQLGDVLFNKLKLPVGKKTKTGPSTDIDVLEELSARHPVPALIVEYRQLAKLKNTYLDALGKEVNPRTGRVHASFNQTIAATGRLSSSDPNLQNIPIKTEVGREIRRAFVAQPPGTGAPEDVLITADYSQIELRMLAHYCQDPALVRAFAEDKDVHRVVAAEIFGVKESEVTGEQRSIAKTVNFGIIYGQTGFGLSKVLHISQEQAGDFITAYRKRFPQIERFAQECVKEASLKGYVTTILGRRRLIPDINSPIQARRQFGQRAALNSVIQGSAADLIKLAMVRIHGKLETRNARFKTGPERDSKLIMQIHDELVLECRRSVVEEVAEMVRYEMEHALALSVPLKVGLAWGRNWLEGK